MKEVQDVKLCDYPAGWEKAKEMLDIEDEKKEGYMTSLAKVFLTQ